jgi:hypothetical protein
MAVRLAARMDAGAPLTPADLRRVEVQDVTWSELGNPALDTLAPAHAEVVAVHEAGHAIVRQAAGASRPVLVTIVPSGRALGRTFFAEDERPILQRRDLIAMAAAALGGRAAEEEVYGAPSAGAIGDLGMAERILLHALKAGISEEASAQALSEYVLSGASGSDPRTMSGQARKEVAEMLAEAWAVAREAVRVHRASLDALTAALLAHRVVEGAALARLLPPAPAVGGRGEASGQPTGWSAGFCRGVRLGRRAASPSPRGGPHVLPAPRRLRGSRGRLRRALVALPRRAASSARPVHPAPRPRRRLRGRAVVGRPLGGGQVGGGHAPHGPGPGGAHDRGLGPGRGAGGRRLRAGRPGPVCGRRGGGHG